jgi:hypothetical protein
MSTLYVDTITEKTAGNGVQIPGHVVQVVNSGIRNTVNANTTSSSYTATGLFVNITPLYSNSNILILCTAQTNYYSGSASSWFDATIFRIVGGVSTDLASPSSVGLGGQNNNTATDAHVPHHISVQDTPATTSTIRYEYFFKRRTGTAILRVNSDGHGLNITAMEIAQ